VLGLTGTGAVVMGLISFVVKVVHIPLTQVLVLKSD
jgi:preprotein translocase subunit Sss1